MGFSLHGRSSFSGHAQHARGHHHRQRIALALVGAAVLLWLVFALLLAPAAAQAGQIVWSKGGDIWTMNDDGSGARVLVPVSAAPGMHELRSPGVDPNGTVVTFNGSTKANEVTRPGMCGTVPYAYSCWTYHYGFWSTGAYRWTAGTVERLSPAPSYCWNCSSGDDDPTPRADGSVVTGFQLCEGFFDDGSYDCVGAIKSSSGASYPSCDGVVEPSPNPVAGSIVAYTGCFSGGNPAVVVSGPDRAGEHVVGCDDAEQSDPAWSPAGDLIATAEGGIDPGLWVYGAANTACFAGSLRHAVVAPSGTSFEHPAFVGAGRIVFEAGGELWAVPSSCNACAFPGAATQLTTGGNNHEPAWTAATLPAAGTTPGGATTPGTTTPGGTTLADQLPPVADLSATKKTQTLSPKTRRITVKVRSTEAAMLRVTGKVEVPGKDPSVTLLKATLPAGKLVTLKVRLSATAMRAVQRAWAARRTPTAVLKLKLTDAAGNSRIATRRVKLKR